MIHILIVYLLLFATTNHSKPMFSTMYNVNYYDAVQ